MTYPCGKGHPHNTEQGMKRCNLKYADKRIERQMKKGPPIYQEVVYDPPLVVDKGGIAVVVFRSAVRIA
jgi:hypothetical protein